MYNINHRAGRHKQQNTPSSVCKGHWIVRISKQIRVYFFESDMDRSKIYSYLDIEL